MHIIQTAQLIVENSTQTSFRFTPVSFRVPRIIVIKPSVIMRRVLPSKTSSYQASQADCRIVRESFPFPVNFEQAHFLRGGTPRGVTDTSATAEWQIFRGPEKKNRNNNKPRSTWWKGVFSTGNLLVNNLLEMEVSGLLPPFHHFLIRAHGKKARLHYANFVCFIFLKH